MKFRSKLKVFIFTGAIFSLAPPYGAFSQGVDEPSKKAHSDHIPKHGGQFFMAPDHWHHLEGTMVGTRDFRLYFYDNYTKPISARSFRDETTIEVEAIDQSGRSQGNTSKLDVRIENKDRYLVASLPPGLAFPLYFIVKIQFPQRIEADLFNFTFNGIYSVDGAKPSANSDVKESVGTYQCPMKDTPAEDKPGKCSKCGMQLQRIKN